MEKINPQRIDQIYQQILDMANKRAGPYGMQNWWAQFESQKLEALAEVWRKYALAGNNPQLQAEAKAFELQVINDLEQKNIEQMKRSGVSQASIDSQMQFVTQEYDIEMRKINQMRAGNLPGQNEFGTDEWWQQFGGHIQGLTGMGPMVSAPFGVGEQNQSNFQIEFGYWASLFRLNYSYITDGNGGYLSHQELIPGIPETGLNAQASNFDIWTGGTNAIKWMFQMLKQITGGFPLPIELFPDQNQQ